MNTLVHKPGGRDVRIRLLTALIFAVSVFLMLAPGHALAHQASDSYLVIDTRDHDAIDIDWSILLRDLEIAVGLDMNDDQRVTRGEFEQRAPAIAAYALQHLTIETQRGNCAVTLRDVQPKTGSDLPMASIHAVARCIDTGALQIGYSLLFDLDTTHRGLLRLITDDGEQTAVLSPQQASQEFDLSNGSGTRVLHFVREGVHHILIGYDHIAFLILLLLPAALFRGTNGWVHIDRPMLVVVDVLRVVTAFTLAHTVTLALAATGLLRLPVPLAELLIALSVIAAAVANILAVSVRVRWMLAFGFGLVHGFGFASVFGELGLAATGLVPTLLAFNLGVELGQLAIVAVVLPLIIVLSRRVAYQRVGFQAATAAIAMLGLFWVAQRVPGVF